MKMHPSSVEEGVGGGADWDLIFLASGDNHPGARRATPPESGGELFSSFMTQTLDVFATGLKGPFRPTRANCT